MREILRSGLWDGEVHWWFSVPDRWPPVSSQSALIHFLDAQEHARLERLRSDELRQVYLVSHVLLRAALSHYANLSPEEWRFRREEFGRLELGREHYSQAPLRFSLAHTHDLATCAIVLRDDIGVDAETEGAHLTNGVAACFAAAERESLSRISADKRGTRALQYWTLKEAFVKALGLGLRVPLNSFWFSSAAGAWELRCEPQLEPSPGSWSFALFSPTVRHQAALAVRRPALPAVKVRYLWMDPECHAQPLALE